jgi:hypothetical protein
VIVESGGSVVITGAANVYGNPQFNSPGRGSLSASNGVTFSDYGSRPSF